MAALPPFPQPDTATQNLLGIQGDITHIQTSGFESAYACTFNDTAAVLYVYNLGQQSPGLALLHRLASQPPHPHVISVLSRHDAADFSYLVSARLQVHLFDEIINVLPNVLPDWRTSRHFAQILSGLRHMHRLGVVHRDIKLDNIMISQQGVLRLIDYKRAVAVPVQPPPGPIFGNTQDQRFVGAPSYVAPEVLAAGQNRPAYDMIRADVWSLGVVLFAMSTGKWFVRVAGPGDRGFLWVRQAQEARSPEHPNGLSSVDAIYRMWQQPNPLNPDLVALLDGMLRINPAERMTLDDVCQSPWLSEVTATIFAHDAVVPLAPELQAWVRAKLRWARLRRGIWVANVFLKFLVDQAKTRAELRGPGVPADAPEDMPQGSEFLEAKEEFELARAGVVPAKFRGLSAEDSPPPVVRSLEELEAAMEKMGVPREEPMPITRENVRQKSESG